MDRKELAYAKQALMGMKDWDEFQALLRTWSRVIRLAAATKPLEPIGGKGR